MRIFRILQKGPDYDDIYDAFPAGELTEEVRDQISLAYEHMQNSYEEAAKGMKICKKLSQTLPAGPLKMLMYSMIQPVIRMKGPRRRVDQVEKRSIMNSVPELAQAIRLPVPVKILAAVGAYYFKLEYGLKVSIKKNAELYDVPEKKFRECIKGVKYDLWIASSDQEVPENYAFSVQKAEEAHSRAAGI